MEEIVPAGSFGRYRVKRELAQGGMGVVYLAFDEEMDRDVAIKSLDERAKTSLVDRLRREAKALDVLDHEHITAIYDMGESDAGLPYLVMEWVDGKTIGQLMREKGKLELDDGLRLATRIARAIHHAHSAGVLHCDLTPSNIMVTEGLMPKIMDFGIARWQTEQVSKVPDRKTYGTPAYMSPEQVRGESLNRRTDIFTLGVVTYYLVTGKRPFGDGLDDRTKIMRSVLEDGPVPLSSIEPKADSQLDRIVQKSLAKNRADRYRTAGEFADALELYLVSTKEVFTLKGSEEKQKAFRRLRGLFATLFFDFFDYELQGIIDISAKRKYPIGETIIEEGATDATLYLIYRGEVSVQQRWGQSVKELKTLRAGECFGEMTFVSKRPRFASIVAKAETGVIAVNEVKLTNLRREIAAKLHRALACVISEKLRLCDKKYRELCEVIEKK